MEQLGKFPYRKVESFGAAGMLDEKSRVFFNTVFNTKNLGRVIDLLCARLAKSGVDELKLREVLTLSTFEAYRLLIVDAIERKKAAILKAKEKAAAAGKEYVEKEEDESLDEPITIECGIDGEKIAVTVSMTYPNRLGTLNSVETIERLRKGEPANEFERLAIDLSRKANAFVLKWQGDKRILELCSLVMIGASDIQLPPEGVEVRVEDSRDAPSALEYTEAGDLDYEELLKSDTQIKGRKGAKLADSLVKRAADAADGDTRLTSGPGDEDEEVKVDGKGNGLGSQQKVSGSRDSTDESSNQFDADPQARDKSKRVAGKKAQTVDGQTVFDGDEAEQDLTQNTFKAGKKKGGQQSVSKFGADEEAEEKTEITFKAGKKGSEEEDSEDIVVEESESPGTKKAKMRVKRTLRSPNEEDASEDEEEFVVESEGQKRERQTKIVFKGDREGGGEAGEETEEVAYGRGGKRIRGDKRAEDAEEVVEEQVQSPGKKLRKLIRRIWPFGNKGQETESGEDFAGAEGNEKIVIAGDADQKETDESNVIRYKTSKETNKDEGREYTFKKSSDEKSESSETREINHSSSESTSDSKQQKKEEVETGSDEILKDFEEKVIDKTVDRVSREAIKLKEEIKDERTKRWVDNLTRDLIAEKSNLRETAKRISANVRQKEHEFKAKQQTLEEEVRKRDEQLAQKTSALNRTREQLTQVSRSLDRMKQLSQEAADAAQFKQKYNLAQKVLQSTKDENSVLQSKLEEMRMQIQQLQLGGKQKGPSPQEYAVLQNKFDRTAKQMDELKRQNQRLLLEASRKGPAASGNAEELKKKAETAARMAAIAKKENELLQGRVAKMQRDDKNLRSEILRLQEALKNASRKPGAGGNAA